MVANYFKVALRALRKAGLHSVITISSLAIGIAAALAIVIFIEDELNFDSFESSNNIYRLNEVQSFEGTNTQHVALSMPGMGPALQEDFPSQIKTYTRFWNWGSRLIRNDENKQLVDNVVAVDSTFLDVFTYPLISGDPATALDQPRTIILSNTLAAVMFNGESGLGENVVINEVEYKVTGIYDASILKNSHLQFNALISLTSVLADTPDFNNQWGSNFLNTYLVLDEGADVPAMEKEFPEFLIRRMDNEDITSAYQLYLQPLSAVHLNSMNVEHDYNNYRKFNGSYINIFWAIAAVILVIASVNFMNLSIARANFRWKEVGVRKSVGALRNQLFIQFLIESLLMTALALFAALLLLLIALPLINQLIGRDLGFNVLIENPQLLILALGGSMLLGLIGGIYPALYMARFSTTRVFRGGTTGKGAPIFRNLLIIVQYTFAIGLIIGTIVVLQQLNFIKNRDVGYDTDQMMLVRMNGEVNEKFEILKTELKNSPYVKGVTATGQRMGNNLHQWGFKVRTDTTVQGLTTSNVNVDYDFFNVYGIDMLQGRGFSEEYASDKDMAFVINQKLLEELQVENPIGMEAGHGWYNEDSLGSIIGVTPNFNFNSLHFSVNTLVMVVHPDWDYEEMSIKIDASDLPEAIADVRSRYENVIADWPFEYSFLDDHFEELYRSDEQMSAVISIMAAIAIFIACMGLFGLSQLESIRRTKEMGIRKVLGASEAHLLLLFARNFTILVVAAMLIAIPCAYFGLQQWLSDFAFRIDLQWWVFPLAGIVAIIIATGTISLHAWRSVRSNPVESLRYE